MDESVNKAASVRYTNEFSEFRRSQIEVTIPRLE